MADSAQLSPGAMLDDKYRIERLLSVGGMGEVYLGTHTLLKKRVAIKVVRPELAAAQGMLVRFQREAVAASKIGHENIIDVTDMGTTRSGAAFLVMEFLEGRSIADAIGEDGPFAVPTSCDIAHGILSGIAAAHKEGIVHRDMKPANVFLAIREGLGDVVKILDFGIAGIAGGHSQETRLTVTGTVVGTPAYMAPEQAGGEKQLTGAVDVYATAVILYEMLTKRIPYEASNYNLLMHKILSADLVPLTERRSDVPEQLVEIVGRALSYDGGDRPSAEEFAIAISPFRSEVTRRVRLPARRARGRDSVEATADTVAVDSSTDAVTGPTLHGPGGFRAVGAGNVAPVVDTLPASAAELRRVPVGPKQKLRGRLIPFFGMAAAGAIVAVAFGFDPFGYRDHGSARHVVAQRAAQPLASAVPVPLDEVGRVEAAQVALEDLPADNVLLEFDVDPPSATIRVAGRVVEDGRFESRARDEGVMVRIASPGFVPYEKEHSLASSSEIRVELEKRRQGRRTKRVRRGREPVDRADQNTPKERIVTDSPYD